VAYLGQIYRATKTQEAYAMMTSIGNELKNVETQGKLDVERLDEIAEEYDARIVIVDQSGILLYSSSVDSSPILIWEEAPKYFREALEQGGELLQNVFGDARKFTPFSWEGLGSPKKNNPESLIYTKIFTVENQYVMVFSTTLLSPVEATEKTVRLILLAVSLLMILLASIIASIISRQLSRPIQKMSDSAIRLAKSDYSVKFPESRIRELSTLSDTLNYATEELQKTDRLQMELVANVSHDLRTPLTMIKGYAEVMQDIPGESTRENLQVIIDETERLTGLVNDLLETSRMQAGMMELRKTEYNLTASIQSVLERYNKLIEKEGYTIDFIPAGDIFVDADEEKIFQVIYNLINNALNYTGDDRKVTVSCTLGEKEFDGEKKPCVTVEVRDSGAGILPEDLPHVWDRYYRSNETHKRAKIGSGIGLSIVRACMELHHALYGVESHENEGSVFWFSLPVIQKEKGKA